MMRLRIIVNEVAKCQLRRCCSRIVHCLGRDEGHGVLRVVDIVVIRIAIENAVAGADHPLATLGVPGESDARRHVTIVRRPDGSRQPLPAAQFNTILKERIERSGLRLSLQGKVGGDDQVSAHRIESSGLTMNAIVEGIDLPPES